MITFAVSQRMLEAAGLYPAAEFQLGSLTVAFS